jgi:hypothetical protein
MVSPKEPLYVELVLFAVGDVVVAVEDHVGDGAGLDHGGNAHLADLNADANI